MLDHLNKLRNQTENNKETQIIQRPKLNDFDQYRTPNVSKNDDSAIGEVFLKMAPNWNIGLQNCSDAYV